MRATPRAILFITSALLVGCDQASTAPPAEPPARVLAARTFENGRVVSGSGDVLRDLGSGPMLTSFAYSAIKKSTGLEGTFTYNFRAAGFFMRGIVTCVTLTKKVAWLGGVVKRVESSDPADQAFVGTDVWWRVEDNGPGITGTRDRTTSLLLSLPGDPTTALSWCADQPLRGIIRPIDAGNIVIHQ